MSLLDLIFQLPKNERTITFNIIVNKCQIHLNDVEKLIMRAMSLELIKGSIDQIDGIVSVTWIIPRVLDN